MLGSTRSLPLLALLLTLQPWAARCEACAQSAEHEALGSEACPPGLQDEVGLMQMHAQLSSKRDASRQHDSRSEALPPTPQLDPQAGRGHRWRARARSFHEWGNQVIFGLSDCYGAVVMSVVERVPGHRRIRHTFSSLLESARGRVPPAPVMVDGGEGMPVGACSCLITFLLMIGLARWILQGRSPSTADQDGKKAAPLLEFQWWHMFVLMQLDCMTPVTQDSYIPSMPVMTQHLNTTETAVGLSLQVNWVLSGVLAFALGVASDKYGRRPILLTALTCYVVGAILCAISPNVECLIFARCFQGIGAGSQPLCYAIARDVIQNDDERSKLFSVFAVAATVAIAVAPIAGGLCAVFMGWRMVFVLLAAWGLLAFWNVLSSLPETNPKVLAGPEREPVEPSVNEAPRPAGGVLGPLLEVFGKSLKPLGMMMSMWMLMPILMSILGSMPFVLDNAFGADTTSITWCSSSLAICSLAGSAICFVFIRNMTSWQLLRLGMCNLGLVGAAMFLGGMFQVNLTVVTFMFLPGLYILCLSTIMGPMRSLVAQPFGAVAGAANGLVMSVGGPMGAFFGFCLTRVFQTWGLFAWMVMLGALASLHQTIFWVLVGPRAEDDPIFEITEGYLQYLKSKGKGKGK